MSDRLGAAKAAAAYVHPKLSAVDASLTHQVEQVDTLAQLMAQINGRTRTIPDPAERENAQSR